MYEKYLRAGGFEPHYYHFYDNDYLQRLYRGHKDYLALPAAWRRRRRDAARIAPCSLVEYELFPFRSWRADWKYLQKTRYVVNFDDNVWEKYTRIPWLRQKFDQVTSHAAGVIAANSFLQERAARLNNNVIKIPTVPDLELYQCGLPKFDKFTVVWIGTPVTYGYLEKAAGTLRAVSRAVPDLELIAVASSLLKPIEGVNMRCLDWSQELETTLLCRSHVGIMPLTDDEFSRGKSSFKIIQYMAAGLPVVASPVGENRLVVKPGETGFLPETPEEWCGALLRLASGHELYQRMSRASKSEGAGYSIQHWGPVMTEFLHQTYEESNGTTV